VAKARVHVLACQMRRHSREQLTTVLVVLTDKRNLLKKQLREFKRIQELEELSNKSILSDYDDESQLLLGEFLLKLTTY